MAGLVLVSQRQTASSRTPPSKPFARILVATNFTATSTPAIEAAIQMAKANGAELVIAHAYQPPNRIQAESVGRGVYEEWDENLRSGIEKKLQVLVEIARRQLVLARLLVVPGAPREALSRAAEENGVDLIVLGTGGRAGIARFFRASVASRVIAAAPCPVLTVRAPRR